MKTAIAVNSKAEGDALKAAMSDAVVHAFIMIAGMLLPLENVQRDVVIEMVLQKFKRPDVEEKDRG